ncbi:MAG: DMT family transporter, partial [Clostridia bacterium]|nr:DMT family transporter [Clostridia bacterium]
LAAMIWGLAFVFQKDASNFIGTFTFTSIRFFLGALSLIPVILIFERQDFADKIIMSNTLKYGIVTGIMLGIASSLQQYSMKIINYPTKVAFITGLYTVLVPVFGFFIGKKTRLNVWISAFIAVLGLYFISFAGDSDIGAGEVVAFIGTIFWTFHILCISKFVEKVSPLKFSFVQFLTASVLNGLCALVFEHGGFSMANIIAAGIPILYTGIMSSGIAYTLQVIGQKNANPAQAAIFLSAEALFSTIGFAVLHHEIMPLDSYIGCALIFIGIILSQIEFKSKNT